MVNLETSGQTQMNKIEPREKIMEVPGESVVNTIVEKVSDGIIAKMNINEERRNREFTYQLKELEFYKSGYDKELRSLFDYWTELVWLAQFKDNGCLSQSEKEKYKDQPTLVIVYMWCSVIAVLKKEILGQFISTTDIMQILITNLDDNMEEIKKAKEYIKKVYKETYKEEPYWTE